MNTNTINAAILSRMFLSGAKNLEAKKEWINELNVFPVPDGDTGTNMTLTIMSAVSEVAALEDPDMESLAKAISSGSLRGARGNSGVILSQLLRGFTRGVQKSRELDAAAIASAMERAVETAYKAVMKPKEGTILTVAREAAECASRIAPEAKDLESFFREIVACAEDTLERTPEMLPVLKEAGVVDSGGQGLVEVLKGALEGYLGNEVDLSGIPVSAKPRQTKTVAKKEETEIKFGYCTEFIILLEKKLPEEEEQEFKKFLNSIGDSIVLVADDDMVKVHVHTNHPGQALEKALTYGSLSHMKIDNMREEHQEKLFKEANKKQAEKKEPEKKEKEPEKEEFVSAVEDEQRILKDYGFISVSVGDGLSEIFKELGVDKLIEGGQTMNPSTEDMLRAIQDVPAKTIYILPNNPNIILAANQARDLMENREIIVVPTKTVPQGITALISFVADKSAKENLAAMEDAISRVKTGQITYAVRDTRVEHNDIHEGDFMGIGDHGILSVGRNRFHVAMETVSHLMEEESELISVYYGKDISEKEAAELREQLEQTYPDCEVELNRGGQPVYYYIISVE